MSVAALAMKKQMVQNYFLYHSDSRTVTVIKDGRKFPAVFDYGFASNNRDSANVQQQKAIPHLTVFSDNIGDLVRSDEIDIDGKGRFTVYEIQKDKTEETFQAEIFLTPVRA